MDTFPYDFPGKQDITIVLLEAEGEDEGGRAKGLSRTAGRVIRRRGQGGLAFIDLEDWSGRIQIVGDKSTTGSYDLFQELPLGSWIGVDGRVGRTKRGQPSLFVETWTLLSPSSRPPGDKWRGIRDPETRYRQRYAELWANPDSRRVLQARSTIVRLVREFLHDRGFLEVETPVLQSIPGGASARPFVSHHNALDIDLYMRIAPELYLKRLVVGGFERVFELGRVFRNEGISTRHNPEFTILEVYEAFADYSGMMDLTESLVVHLAEMICGSATVTIDGQAVSLERPWRRVPMVDLVEEVSKIRLDLDSPDDRFRHAADRLGVALSENAPPGVLLAEIYEGAVEKNLVEPTFVTDYPTEISPLARDHRQKPGYTERFELIVGGKELANAFSELNDPVTQEERFRSQAVLRELGDDEAMMFDADYIRALEYGLPPTGGLGIGIDRLVMLLTGATTIRDVILFPTLRPESS